MLLLPIKWNGRTAKVQYATLVIVYQLDLVRILRPFGIDYFMQGCHITIRALQILRHLGHIRGRHQRFIPLQIDDNGIIVPGKIFVPLQPDDPNRFDAARWSCRP